MKAVKISLLCIGISLCALSPSFSQHFTQRDQAEITYNAHITLSMYKDLLNVISYTDITDAEVKELIRNSYSDPKTQIFYSDAAIIEDNVKPSNLKARHEQDKNVKDYLRYFDLMYAKSDEQSIEFSEFSASNLKYREYPYIRVKYTSLFRGKHKEDTVSYQAVERLAELRVERKDNQWRTYIVSIVYYNPANPIASAEGDVVLDESVSDDGTFSNRLKALTSSTNSLTEREKAVQLSDYTHRQDSVFSLYMQKGQQAFAAGKYEEAVAAYTQAQQINPYDITPRIKINELTQSILDSKNSVEQSFQEALTNGDRAKAARDYTKAKNFYAQALTIKPHESSLKPRISDLDKIIQNQASLDSKFNVGDYKGAIKDYSKAIKENKHNPDYFYGRGKCYEKLNDIKEAIKDYTSAIELDGNFIEALNSRGRLYVQTQQRYEAIADYSIIISNPDYAADFYPVRAKVRTEIGDFKGAMEDYDAASSLKPEQPDNYYQKGLIQAKQEQFEEAITSFSKAIERNNDFVNALYHRGLAYVKRDNAKLASQDFARAKALGLDNGQLAAINNIAFTYFSQGELDMRTTNYGNALGSYMNAVLISPTYAGAWLRKGDAHAMLEDFENALMNYNESLEIDTLSYAYYRRGVAHERLGNQAAASSDFMRYIPIGAVLVQQKTAAAKDGNQSKSVAAQLTEDNAFALYALGYAQLMSERYAAALESLNKAISINKTYSQGYFARGLAQYGLKEYKKAVKDMEESVKLGLSDAYLFYSLGKAYEAKGDLEEAIKRYSQALSIDKAYEAAYKQRALCYKNTRQYKLGLEDIYTVFSLNQGLQNDVELLTTKGLLELYQYRFDEANTSFDSVLSLGEDNAWALYGKACALSQQNKKEESIALYRKAFQLKQIGWSSIKNDPFVKLLNKDKEFKALVKASF